MVVAILVSAMIMAVTGGLAYLTTTSLSASGHVRVAAAEHPAGPPSPIQVTSLAPASGSAGLTGATTVQITLSAPLAADSAMPRLRPATPGQWLASGNELTFTPDTALAPGTRFTLTIPAGADGLRSAAGGVLARGVVARFRTEQFSALRLAQLLGELGYLPLSWQPDLSGHLQAPMFGAGLPAQEAMAYSPPAGTFTWEPGYPSYLRSQWWIGESSPVIRGAVMAFQSQHGMAINGVASAGLWHALFAAAGSRQGNAAGYTYAIASKGSPETLTVWHDGQVVLRSLANTGIPDSPTVDGTFPVYSRFRFTIMSGTNPDGTHYSDPVSFVSYFNGGDAVHYFPRGSYGFPQSLGCVELPYTSAERAWPYLSYGSLVTVSG